MKRFLLMALPLLLAACGGEAPADAPPGGPEGGPPPPPPYQLRAELPEGNRLAATASHGDTLYSNRCGTCHLAGGMGTNLLTMQQIKAGAPPEMGLLTNRTDLTADYIKQVVRSGKVAMPPVSRVEVTDAELEAIATFLAKDQS